MARLHGNADDEKRKFWLRRAHSVGHKRQHLNLLTYALWRSPGLTDI